MRDRDERERSAEVIGRVPAPTTRTGGDGAAAPREGAGRERVRVLDILRVRELRVVIVATFVVMLGFGILAPALPLYARSFGVGLGAVGALNSAFAIGRLVFDLVAGPLVRRYGERAMVAAGAVVVGVTSALAAWAPTFGSLVALRAIGGAGSSVFFAALMSYMLRTSPRDRVGRVMGVFWGAFNLGMILGTPIGGLVAHAFGLASPLLLYAGACLVAAVMYLRAAHDPARGDERPRGRLRDLRWTRSFVAVLVANGAYFWMVAGVYQTLLSPFQKDRVGLSLSGIGLGFAVTAVAEFVVLFPAGAATDRFGRKAVLVPSFLAIAAVVATFGFATSIPLLVIELVALGVAAGFGGVPPMVMLSDVVPETHRPAAIGVFRFVGDLGFVLGPLVAGGAAASFGYPVGFALSAVPCAVAFLVWLAIPDTMRRSSDEPSPATVA